MYFLGAILFPGRANQQLLVKLPSLHDTLVVSHGWPGPIFRLPQQTYLSLSTTGYTSITARQLSSGNVMFSVVSVRGEWELVSRESPAVPPVLPPSHMGTSPFPAPSTLDLFKLVHYVPHTSISKRVVGFRLKGLHVWRSLCRTACRYLLIYFV